MHFIYTSKHIMIYEYKMRSYYVRRLHALHNSQHEI